MIPARSKGAALAPCLVCQPETFLGHAVRLADNLWLLLIHLPHLLLGNTMKSLSWGIFAILLLSAFDVHATPIVTLGTYSAPQDSLKTISINVTDSVAASLEDIEGMTLTLQIGSGTGLAPSIHSIDLTTATIWSGAVSPGNISVSAGVTNQFESISLITDNAGEFVNPNGFLATVVVDTTNATPGPYLLFLIGTKDPGSDSQFLDGLGDPVSATIGSGTLNVLPVPEPSAILLLAVAASVLLTARLNARLLYRATGVSVLVNGRIPKRLVTVIVTSQQ
jgi:hypothetical protein